MGLCGSKHEKEPENSDVHHHKHHRAMFGEESHEEPWLAATKKKGEKGTQNFGGSSKPAEKAKKVKGPKEPENLDVHHNKHHKAMFGED